MITLTESLKKRFCKDQNLPIKVYSEPIFTERLKLFDAYEKYLEFCAMFRIRFDSDEQAYFAYYNDLKDRIINYIKESEAFQSLNKADMYKEFPIYGEGIPKVDTYKDKNIGKSFLSIDMKKANFNALVHYGNEIGTPFSPNLTHDIDKSWSQFMEMFTDIPYFATSKYIRQVVFGNCNPKRVIAYETYLMTDFLSKIQFEGETFLTSVPHFLKKDIYSMCSDEIILHMDDLRLQDIEYIQKRIAESPLDLRMEQYTIGKIAGTDVFVKIFTDGEMEIKCTSAEEAVFAQKLIKGIPFDDHDFYISTKYGTAVLTEFDTTALKLIITQEELENESTEDFEYGE